VLEIIRQTTIDPKRTKINHYVHNRITILEMNVCECTISLPLLPESAMDVARANHTAGMDRYEIESLT